MSDFILQSKKISNTIPESRSDVSSETVKHDDEEICSKLNELGVNSVIACSLHILSLCPTHFSIVLSAGKKSEMKKKVSGKRKGVKGPNGAL